MTKGRLNEEKRFLAVACLVPYEQARRDIRNADLLLFRKTGIISIAGRGIHSHAAKAAWWGNDLFCLEVREFHGGRAVTLESQTRRYPGRIDVFRANAENRWPEYNRVRATAAMRRFAGCDYGYWNVFKTALTHIPFLRFLYRPALANDGEENWRDYLFGGRSRSKSEETDQELFEQMNGFEENGGFPPADHFDGDFGGLSGPIEHEAGLRYSDWSSLRENRDGVKNRRRKTTRCRISPPYCSEACSIADRIGGGVNPVELLSDRFTEPADLARSPFYHYLFTLE